MGPEMKDRLRWSTTTTALVSIDLGGSYDEPHLVRNRVSLLGVGLAQPSAQSRWRQLRYDVIESLPFKVEGDAYDPWTCHFRLHQLGVLSLLFRMTSEAATVEDIWRLNEVVSSQIFGDMRDRSSDLYERVQLIRDACSDILEHRPEVSERVSVNTIQLLRAEPRDRSSTESALREFSALQGGSVGPGGDLLLGAHCHLLVWESLVVCQHDGTGQLLAVTDSDAAAEDLSLAHEYVHSSRFWLRALVDVLDGIELPDLRQEVLGEDDLQRLAASSLDLAELRQDIAILLARNDEFQLPLDSNLGRQLVLDLASVFALDRWRAGVKARLEAVEQRSVLISGVLSIAYQAAARQQAEKLQLLFAGSVAATIMALLPAILSLVGWKRPAALWIAATVGGVAFLWILVVFVVIRVWRFRIRLLPGA